MPYRYFLHRFAGHDVVDSDSVYRIYRSFLEGCGASSSFRSTDWAPSHNLILTSGWLLVIPRRYPGNEAYTELLPNGAGMMGTVSARDQRIVDKWMAEGPARVLAAFGLPPDS